MRHLFALFLLVSFAMAACSDADTDKPVISDLIITPTPGQGMICGSEDSLVIAAMTGDSITISMTVTDDEQLSQYKIDIHQNFDCHGHSKVATADWEVIDIVEISGTSTSIQRTIYVPDSATVGTYHFSIQVADHFGNSARTERFSINVLNSDDLVPPTFTVTAPTALAMTLLLNDTVPADTVPFAPNDSIIFTGNLTDNLALGVGGNGRIELRYWRDSTSNVFQLYNLPFIEGTHFQSVDFNFMARVPGTLTVGGYIFELRAFDGVNNPATPVRYMITIE